MAPSEPLPPFQSLLDAHADAVLGFLRGTVGPAAAEDCFQETFLAALRAYPRLEHGRELRAWLLTIARRKAFDYHRAAKRRPLTVAEPGELVAAVAPEANGASEWLDAAALWGRVAELPEGQRGALGLRFAGELPYRDVAAALGCSEQAARRRVHDGLGSLRRNAPELRELIR